MASLIGVGRLAFRSCLPNLRFSQGSPLIFQASLLNSSYGSHGIVREISVGAILQDAFQIRMPSLSPTMQKGTIIKWYKKEGDAVAPGDVLCDIQTDKAVLGFEVDEEGTLAKILKPDNSVDVNVGTLIALISEPGEDWKKVTVPAEAAAAAPSATAVTSPAAAATHGKQNIHSYGPAVRSILDIYDIRPNQVTPTGPHGRLLKGDLLRHIKDKGLKPAAVSPQAPPTLASAAAKPTAQASRPTSQAAKPAAQASRPTAAATAAQLLGEPDAYTDLQLTSMRSVIAKRLTESKTTIPHTYATMDCKMDNLLRMRKELQNSGIKVGVNDFIIKAAALALQKVPGVNTVWSGESVKQLTSVDISIAVATENGLITPIVKNAANLSVEEIAVKVKDLAGRARLGKLKLEEFQGGSFTISNLGMFGISWFSAVINPPQTCILAVGGSRVVPSVDESSGDLVPQTIMSVTSSADARVVDDLLAVQFLAAFAEIIDNPVSMMLGGNVGSQQAQSKGSPQSSPATATLQKLFAK